MFSLFLLNCGTYESLPLPLNALCTWTAQKGDQDCATTRILNVCLEGVCIVKSCSTDNECPLGNKCENNECATLNPCKTDQDCLEKTEPGRITSYCYNGQCLIQYCKPRYDCNQDDPECYTECPENQECYAIDKQITRVCIFKKQQKLCNPGQTRPCYSANSGCSLVNGKFNCNTPCKTGVQICDQNGNWQKTCNGEVTPQKEICDNKDNDCNGKVDENLNCPCKVGTIRQCFTGAKGCYKKPDGTFKCIGECRAGTQYCRPDKTWSNCSLQVLPDNEYCNGNDDDCDGRVDEDFPKLNKPCYVGVGECKDTGKFVCSPNRQQTLCTAVAKPPKQEICDGKDNNCNGYIDENVTKECYPFDPKTKNVGICRPTYVACYNGQWGKCPPGAIGPQKETCNGKDDDCDGKKDEDFPNLKKTCYAGKYACTQRGYYLCTGDHKGTYCYIPKKIIPSKEMCRNAKDEDCDGYTDFVRTTKGGYVYNKYCSPMKFLYLENRNTFVMGCDPQKDTNCDAKTEKKRTIIFQRNAKKGLYVSVFGVNCYLFERMMKYKPSNCIAGDYPLTYISWHEAAAFTNALSRRDNLQECFICNGTGSKIKCTIRFSNPKDYYSCTGYRLPTSAEYEWFASCAGKIKTVQNPYYNHFTPIRPLDKKQFLSKPNCFGIYDVVGNLFMWTADSCNTTKTTTNTDPIVYDPNSKYKVVRGGCYYKSKNKQDCFVYKQKCTLAQWSPYGTLIDKITVYIVRTYTIYK